MMRNIYIYKHSYTIHILCSTDMYIYSCIVLYLHIHCKLHLFIVYFLFELMLCYTHTMKVVYMSCYMCVCACVNMHVISLTIYTFIRTNHIYIHVYYSADKCLYIIIMCLFMSISKLNM